MQGNSFGKAFLVTTFGESHGKAVGVIIDGVPPLVPVTEQIIQKQLDRRKPGQSDMTTPRKESDTVHIVSGIFEGKTTGTPLTMILYSSDANPSAYNEIKNKFRPGHADYTYLRKYGIRDWRGSGRASGRETAGRVAAGAVARQVCEFLGINVLAYTKQVGSIACRTFDETVIEKNPLRACDLEAAEQMSNYVKKLIEEEDSAGGIVECRMKGVPAGIGEPVFEKLDALLAQAMLSIGAVKGIEFGSGFNCAIMKGSEHNDEMDKSGFLSNNAGGVLGGISSGQDIIFRIPVKPTSSIAKEQHTRDVEGNPCAIKTQGRHDPCICPRIVPVVEAMTYIVLLDLYIRQFGPIKMDQ